MGQISPSLPPQIPRSRPQEPSGPREPNAQTPPGAREAPDADRTQPRAQPLRAPPQGQRAAKLPPGLGKLAKGLMPGVPASRRGSVDRTAPRSQTERARGHEKQEALHDDAHVEDESESSTDSRGGGKKGAKGAEAGLLGAAFAALKRARTSQVRKARRKKTGAARELDHNHLDDDDEEDVLNRPSMKAWLRGDEAEESSFGEARREARLLEEMDRQGAAPSLILGELNGQLSGARGTQFKRLLSTEVRPQMDLLAERVGQISTDERRRLAALVSRALHQVGSQNSATFDKLLASTATAEAQHLAGSTEPVITRAEEFTLALQRAAGPTYRATLVDKGRATLEKLAAEAAALPVEALQGVLVAQLRAAQILAGPTVTTLAEGFVTGLLAAKTPTSLDTLARALAPALRIAPGGAFWAVQAMLLLEGRGEAEATQKLANILHGAIRESRQLCLPGFQTLKDSHAAPLPAEQLAEVWRQLDSAAVLAAELMPTCGALWALHERLPITLVIEALLALGTLDLVGTSAPGQRMLRGALLAQERGEWSFLSTVPQMSPSLADPRVVEVLADSGLVAAHYTNGARLFLQRVATQTARALSGPVVARSQKGEAMAARTLMSTALYLNAELFGLNAEGAGLAVDVFDTLRAKPHPSLEKRFWAKLVPLARRYPSDSGLGSIEGLRELVTALAQRDPQTVKHRGQARQEADDAPRVTALDIEAVQISMVKERQEKQAALDAEQAKAARPKPGQARPRPPGTPPTRR